LQHPRKLKLASKLAERVMSEALKPASEADPRVKMSDAVRMGELVYRAAGELERDQQSVQSQSFTQITINGAYFGGSQPPYIVPAAENVAENVAEKAKCLINKD